MLAKHANFYEYHNANINEIIIIMMIKMYAYYIIYDSCYIKFNDLLLIKNDFVEPSYNAQIQERVNCKSF